MKKRCYIWAFLVLAALLLVQGRFVYGQDVRSGDVKSQEIQNQEIQNQEVQSKVLKGEKVSFQLNNVPEVPDEIPPEITILSPPLINGVFYVSEEPEVVLVGKLSDESDISMFSIGDNMVEYNREGGFISSLQLERGQNRIRLVALDKKNNMKEHTLYVNYTPPEPTLADKIKESSVYYALIIGIDKYKDNGLNDLDNPIADCKRLIEALTTNYFFEKENIIFLQNATRSDLVIRLDELSSKVSTNDNLLIFYAGHGTWDERSNNGWWLPSDAERDNKANWFRNSAMVDYLNEIESKHTLLITDACFGGSIFETRSGFSDDDEAYEFLYNLPSRTAMTSGNKSEVPDRSSFTRYLVERLNSNRETYLSSAHLFVQ